MQASDTAIILIGGLGAAISWGISGYFAAHSAKKIGPTLAAAVVNILGALLFVLIYLGFMRGSFNLELVGVLYSVLSGIILSIGAVAFFRGLEKGPVSIVSPLTSLYPLATTVIAVTIFGAKLSLIQTLGILLIIGGVLVASGLLGVKKPERKIASGPRYGLLAALFWGIGYSLLAQGISRIGWETASVIEFVFVAITFLILTPLIKGNEVINKTQISAAFKNKFVIGASVIQLIGVMALNYGLSKESSSGAVVTALSACYPIITVFLALKHMKEQTAIIPLVGAFVGIVGVIILILT